MKNLIAAAILATSFGAFAAEGDAAPAKTETAKPAKATKSKKSKKAAKKADAAEKTDAEKPADAK